MWSHAKPHFRGGRPTPKVGVQELKARASEVVQNVRERRARYIVTYRRPVRLLLPLEEGSQVQAMATGDQGAAVWAHISAATPVIPDPQKGSRIRSPGSV